jgi:hypothetical protein
MRKADVILNAQDMATFIDSVRANTTRINFFNEEDLYKALYEVWTGYITPPELMDKVHGITFGGALAERNIIKDCEDYGFRHFDDMLTNSANYDEFRKAISRFEPRLHVFTCFQFADKKAYRLYYPRFWCHSTGKDNKTLPDYKRRKYSLYFMEVEGSDPRDVIDSGRGMLMRKEEVTLPTRYAEIFKRHNGIIEVNYKGFGDTF